jgi:hypothetical protein
MVDLPMTMRASSGRLLGLYLVLAAIAIEAGCAPAKTAMPAELLGLWKTSAPRHSDNFLEIRPHSLMLGVAGMELDVLEVEWIEHERDPWGNDIYRFHYTAAEGYEDVLAVTKLRNSRGIRVAAGEGTWFPAKHR